jgi:hypothetical protein
MSKVNVKEVNVRKFISLLFILILLFSLNTFAKDAFSFEPYEYPDSVAPAYMDPFFSNHRDSKPEDFSIVEGAKWWHGSHSVMINMTHPGNEWNILAKNKLVSGEAEAVDTTFLDDLDIGDTLYYYVYIPWSCPVDSIFIFVRNENWNHDEHTVYHPSDLHFGRWNALKDGISEFNTDGDPFTFPLIQSDFEIHTNPAVNPPACTLYWDCPSSKGRVPCNKTGVFPYCDSLNQGGIEMQDYGALKVAKASINCVEYAINVTTPVMVQVFDLTGRKQKEIPIGVQPAGTYSIPVDLSAGVYITVITAGEEIENGKIICVK